jgi:hypothetical protein
MVCVLKKVKHQNITYLIYNTGAVKRYLDWSRYQTMRATRRRNRQSDSLASPEAVTSIFARLRAALPDIIPCKDKDLIRMLRAARHIQRYAASDTKRGRPSHWKREDVLKVSTRLNDILERETSSHISLASFVDHYLRLLDFPADVAAALSSREINLFEAAQLARISAVGLGSTPSQAKRTRTDLLSTHLQTKESGPRLRQRVNELLRASANDAGVTEKPDLELNLEDFDPYDPTHLFWDQIKHLGFALRDIRREDVLDEEIEELLKASEPVLTILAKIQRRKEKKPVMKLKI